MNTHANEREREGLANFDLNVKENIGLLEKLKCITFM